jgi:hypothetical protein
MANVIHEARQGLTAALHEIEREEKRLLRALRSLEGRGAREGPTQSASAPLRTSQSQASTERQAP